MFGDDAWEQDSNEPYGERLCSRVEIIFFVIIAFERCRGAKKKWLKEVIKIREREKKNFENATMARHRRRVQPFVGGTWNKYEKNEKIFFFEA